MEATNSANLRFEASERPFKQGERDVATGVNVILGVVVIVALIFLWLMGKKHNK